MAKSNKTKYAVLGLLAAGPLSGYDIKKIVDQSIGFFWNENFGHLYPILGRMAREGLVTMSLGEKKAGPVKKVYSITARGRKELMAWLKEPAEENPVRNELLLKIFFSGRTGGGEVRDMVRAELRKNRELVEVYSGIQARIAGSKSGDAPFWKMTLDFGIRKANMVIEWCDETLRVLARMK